MKIILMLLAWMLLESVSVSAQQPLFGKIIDSESREPLAGATVIITGTTFGTTTNMEGKFTLNSQDDISTVTVSYIGYGTETVRIPNPEELVTITLDPETLNLSEVVVTGFQNNRRIVEVAGGITSLKPAQIQRFDNSSLQLTLNSVPGVRMESTAPGGSTRISIRGSLLRSPWGIRGIKAYWNGLPLTDAGGSTPYDIFDPAILGNLEILKGPSGSIYGAGTGGVMLFKSSTPGSMDTSFESAFSTGSFGLNRYEINASFGGQNSRFRIGYTDQNYDGYRPNQSTYHRIFNMTGNIITGDKGLLSFYGYQVNRNFDLPGNLTLEEYQDAPRQSIPFAIENNTRLTSESANLGASYQYDLLDNLTSTTALYVSNSATPEHPTGTNPFSGEFFKGNTSGIGGRITTAYTRSLGMVETVFTAGAEFQKDRGYSISFGLDEGELVADDLRESIELVTTQQIYFAQMELDLPYDFIITGGGSLNYLDYAVEDMLHTGTSSQSGLLKTEPTIAPRFSLVKKLDNDFSIHGSIGRGFSPPGRHEINANGRINSNLLPEDGVNYEIGLRGDALNRLNIDVTAYTMQLNNVIIQRRLESGLSRFENGGSASQKGIEAMAGYSLFNSPNSVFTMGSLWINYTYNDYTFKNYQLQDDETGDIHDFSGNQIPGISPHVLSTGFDIDTHSGFYGNVNFYFFDDRYITNANDVADEGYTLLNTKLGYRLKFANNFIFDLHTGIKNIQNTPYVGTLGVNGFGGRYYNLGTPRSFYGGVNLKYQF